MCFSITDHLIAATLGALFLPSTMGKKSGGRVRVKQVGPKAPVNPLDALTIPPEEMINFPVKPDTNISHVWPMSTCCLLTVFAV